MEELGNGIAWASGIVGGLTIMVGTYLKIRSWATKKIEVKTCAEVALQTEPLSSAMRAVLRCLLVQTYEQAIARESISIMAIQSAEAMYAAYHGLHGNGFVDGLMDDIRKLPKG